MTSTNSAMTTLRSDRTGTQIRATASAELEPQLRGLISQFEGVAEEWRHGFSLHIGWAPLWLREEDDGFTIFTRDFQNDPRTADSDDLTLMIQMTVGLLTTARTVGIKPEDVRWDELVFCIDGWDTSELVSLVRSDDRAENSTGWFVDASPPRSKNEATSDEMVAVPVWKMLQLRPAIARALSLRSTTVTLAKGDHIVAIFDTATRQSLFQGKL